MFSFQQAGQSWSFIKTVVIPHRPLCKKAGPSSWSGSFAKKLPLLCWDQQSAVLSKCREETKKVTIGITFGQERCRLLSRFWICWSIFGFGNVKFGGKKMIFWYWWDLEILKKGANCRMLRSLSSQLNISNIELINIKYWKYLRNWKSANCRMLSSLSSQSRALRLMSGKSNSPPALIRWAKTIGWAKNLSGEQKNYRQSKKIIKQIFLFLTTSSSNKGT